MLSGRPTSSLSFSEEQALDKSASARLESQVCRLHEPSLQAVRAAWPEVLMVRGECSYILESLGDCPAGQH